MVDVCKPLNPNQGLWVLGEETRSSPFTIKGAPLDSEVVIAPSADSSEKFQGKPAVLQTWLEAEDLAYKLYTDRHLYGGKGEAQSPILVRTFRENGIDFDDIYYRVKRVETPEGLNAFILQPIFVPEGETPEVKVIFAGTADKEGVVRDLDKKAAGHESFKSHKHDLMHELNMAVASITGDDVRISVIGHSLGGADAQRMALKITQAVAFPGKPEDAMQGVLADSYFSEKPYYPALKNKNITLHLGTNSAPRLTEKQCEKFAKNLEIATKNSNNGFNPLKFEATVFCMDKDIVPRCGKKHLLTQEETEEHPSVLSMANKATVVSIKSTLFGHALNFYHNPDHPKLRGMDIVETTKETVDENKEKEVKGILGKKSIDASTFADAIRAAIRSLTIKLGWGEDLNSVSTPDSAPVPASAVSLRAP